MKKIIYLLAFAALFAACSKELAPAPVAPDSGNMVPVTFEASVSDMTRAGLDGLSVVWSKDDKLAVFDGVASSYNVFTLVSGEGTTTGVFTGSVSSGATDFYAVYPESAAKGLKTGETTALELVLPDVQIIPSGAQVAPYALLAVSKAAEGKFQFHNVVSLAKVSITGDGVESFTLSAADKGVAPASVSFSPETGENTGAFTGLSYTARASDGTFAKGDYYLAVLPGDYVGINLSVANGSGRAIKSSSNTASFKRSGCLNLGDLLSGLTTAPLSIRNATELQAWAKCSPAYLPEDIVPIVNDIDMSGVTFEPATSFAGALDGNGKKLLKWTSNTPLVKVLECSAMIQNLTIGADSKLTFPNGYDRFGFVVCDNYGTVSGVVNEASASMNEYCCGEAASAFYGILVGRSFPGSVVENCSNTGNFEFDGVRDVASKTLYFGGIAGGIQSSDAHFTAITNCSNSGNISFSVESDEVSTNSWHIGGVAGACNSYAMAFSCTNEGSITFTAPSTAGLVSVAGVVSYMAGDCTECINKGPVNLLFESAEGAADGFFRSAIASGVAGYISRPMVGCENTAGITLRAGYNKGAPLSLGDIKSMIVSAASGIVSYCAGVNGTVENCNNSGQVSATLNQIENAEATTAGRHNVGGIASSTSSTITGCVNAGPIIAEYVTSTHDASLNKQVVVSVGGISGGAYQSTTKGKENDESVIDCINNAAITVNLDSSQSNSCVAGISAWPGSENTNNKGITTNCTNAGNITVRGFGKVRMGGIHGGTGSMDGCTNSGSVSLFGGHVNSAVGGLCGFLNFHSIKNSKNTGTVRSSVVITNATNGDPVENYKSQAGIGGLVGGIGNTDVVFTGNTSACTVSAPEGCKFASMIIGMIDRDKKPAIGKSFAVGTAEAPIKVKGKFGDTVLTKDNYDGYIRYEGYLGLNDGVTFNTVFDE